MTDDINLGARGLHVLAAALLISVPLVIGACGGDDDDDSDAAGETSTTISDEQLADQFEAYVGLSEEEAAQKAEDEGLTSRVIEREGEPLAATMDYDPERLNFVINDGKVTLVTTG